MSVEAPEGTHPVDAGARADTTSAPASVSGVIPALNQAQNMPEVARRMPTGIDEIEFDDSHSVDNCIEMARALWPSTKIISQTRRGKGNALATSDIVMMIDTDGSGPAEICLFTDLCYGYTAFWQCHLPAMSLPPVDAEDSQWVMDSRSRP